MLLNIFFKCVRHCSSSDYDFWVVDIELVIKLVESENRILMFIPTGVLVDWSAVLASIPRMKRIVPRS
jgi:hypothetical protein